MGLMDVIRRILGESEALSPGDAGFSSLADSDGINFFLDRARLEALHAGTGSPLEKVQLVVLRMLLEQGLAEQIANGFHLPSEHFASLDDEQAEILRSAPRFTGAFASTISGRTGNSGFRVDLVAGTDSGTAPFVRKGPLLYLTQNEAYRLTPAELLGLKAWERHRDLPPEKRGETENVRLMAMLQTAARSGMRIDLAHFERLDVVVPEGIGVVATRLPDGSLLLCPSLGEGSTPEELDRRWSQLDTGSEGGVLRVDNRVVLLDPQKIAGIREVLGNRRIPADKVAEFIATPSAFLDAALVDPEIGFSVRVMGVGKLQHMDFGELVDAKRDWFGVEDVPLPPESLQVLIRSTEDLDRFREVYEAAKGQGAASVVFGGGLIDVSEPEAVEVQLLRKQASLLEPPPEGPFEPLQDVEPKESVSVLLRDTDAIVAQLLQKARGSRRIREPDWSNCLRSPFPHQREGIDWMLGLLASAVEGDRDDVYRLQGALLADDMGLGKTYMSLVCLAEYMEQQKLSWNLALQALGWGRYLAERQGLEPVLWRAATENLLLPPGDCLLAPCETPP